MDLFLPKTKPKNTEDLFVHDNETGRINNERSKRLRIMDKENNNHNKIE